MALVLLDTGPLVAWLDRRERMHPRCVEFLLTFRERFVTTVPVVTEAMYLLNDQVRFQRACYELLLRLEVEIASSSAVLFARAMQLMEQYASVPMDFADATLVALAEERRLARICTLDHRGFSVYRMRGKECFTMLPGK